MQKLMRKLIAGLATAAVLTIAAPAQAYVPYPTTMHECVKQQMARGMTRHEARNYCILVMHGR